MEKIKLVIWDLDETFWKGTLSEGEVEISNQNVEIVKELTRRGIINSVSSKNDFDRAKNQLQRVGIWEYFVFPSIDWAPKGQNIKRIIENCQLRAPNVLFIDDNIGNRKEAQYYNDGINVANESIIPQLLGMVELKGKDDSGLSRLKQYKILENKAEAKATYNDNATFLRDSNIKVKFYTNCKEKKDRIFELINRTNQLNYTKNRLTEEELELILDNPLVENVCLRVVDRFGDYGICGYYAYERNSHKLLHFLFSCRILNLGIPAWVFQYKLNKPEIIIKEPVAEKLDLNGIDWIHEIDKLNEVITEVNRQKKIRILLLGGCDLEQMCHYLDKDKYEIIKEFNYPNNRGIPVHKEHTVYLKEMESLSDEEKNEMFRLPFGDNRMLNTILFTGEYDILVYSVLMNYTHEIYENKEFGFRVAYGGYMNQNMLCDYLKLNSEEKCSFISNYNFIGLQNKEDFITDLKWIINKIGKPVIIINGAETEDVCRNELYAGKRHKEMNKALDEFIRESQNSQFNIKLLDVRKYVKEVTDHKDTIRHYQRIVYLNMAKELTCILSGGKQNKLKLSTLVRYYTNQQYEKLRHLIGSSVRKMLLLSGYQCGK